MFAFATKYYAGIAILAVVAILAIISTTTGCQSKTVTNPDGTTTVITGDQQAYNSAVVVAQNLEAVANGLAAAGVLPQIDVTLGTNAINEALNLWQQAMNANASQAKASPSTLSVEQAKQQYYQAVADFSGKISNAQKAKVARLSRH